MEEGILGRFKELSPYHKFVKGQIHHTSGLEQVVFINIARGMWRLGTVEKLNKGTVMYRLIAVAWPS